MVLGEQLRFEGQSQQLIREVGKEISCGPWSRLQGCEELSFFQPCLSYRARSLA